MLSVRKGWARDKREDRVSNQGDATVEEEEAMEVKRRSNLLTWDVRRTKEKSLEKKTKVSRTSDRTPPPLSLL